MLTGIVVALAQERRTLACLRDDARFEVVLGGPGADNAKKAAEHLVEVGCGRLISWGVAGALVDQYGIGELVEPRRVCTPNTTEALEVDDSAAEGTLMSTPTIVTSGDKAALRDTGATLVDMESYAIGTVCHQRGVDFHVCRAVVDTANARWIDQVATLLDELGRLRIRRLLAVLFRHPGSLITAGLANRKALRTLERRAVVLLRTGR